MKTLTVKQIGDGVAALDQLRERIIPKSMRTPRETIERLFAENPESTHLEQVFMWDEKGEFLTVVNYAVPSNPGDGENDTRPCPPFCEPG